MAIPASTNRAHLEQRNPYCDTARVLNMAAVRRPGCRFADMNCVPCADADLNLHWPDGPGKNHFTHIMDGGKRRPMTHEELHRPVIKWDLADVKRWRKRLSKRVWCRPFSVRERNLQARRRLVVICWEMKSTLYGHDLYAKRLVNACKGWTTYFMTLVTMRGWGFKLAAVKRAGGPTALLTHGARKPSDFAHFDASVDRLWPNHWGNAHSRLGAS